ncbi:DUF2147 domain-containing protein [Chryseolinea lacunae]|uniref:DUF2147 domain-containing protein n=1 Tax=Chryseolinea lacunae TaxID=2801331 RepID=A0ABS1L2E7_9BACT|nr:DUF2147 domain-containing protein [Chryseolinea lacunae]MBL0745889.1 DUF2147 domain-containing protein [Chryseolinea lacunae]
MKMIAKNYLITTGLTWLMSMAALQGHSQVPEKLKGIWTNEQGTRKTDFYEVEGKYFGKLVWVSDDSKLKAGDLLFKELVWNGKKFHGTAVTPARGDLSCVISFEGDDKLKITASKGGMSKSVYWTRVK